MSDLSKLHYTDSGSGKVVVLLHGYLETSEIWKNFSAQLASMFRVIVVDIPGHGKSAQINEVHTMDLMAETIDCLLINLNISTCNIIGHSMGGYIALAYLYKYKHKVASLCLFHSTPFADTSEKQENRNREIELIKKGHLQTIINTNIAKGFATDSLGLLNADVATAKQLASTCNPSGVVALLKGMKQRIDHQALIKSTDVPILLILGKKDNYIAYNVVEPIFRQYANCELVTLSQSGHMGFIEEPQLSFNTIKSFVSSK
jgi:pimeloyl-ACP methyl ester carboxylesterase